MNGSQTLIMENIKPIVWQITKADGTVIYVEHNLLEDMIQSEMPSATICIDTMRRLYRVSKVVPLYNII